MAHTLIDIFNGVIKYDGNEIIVIIDDNNVPWFSASNVSKILGYIEKDKAIRMHTKKHDRKQFNKIQKFAKNIPSYMKPNAIFINESGLYSLILSSKMPKAEKFRDWVTSEVLPSI